MKDELKDDPEQPAKQPIFLERGDGLGWTLNFNRPVSFVILILFLALVTVACLFAGGFIKL